MIMKFSSSTFLTLIIGCFDHQYLTLAAGADSHAPVLDNNENVSIKFHLTQSMNDSD